MSALYLTTKDAAQRLSMSVRAFEQWATRNGIPTYKLGRRTNRYLASDLDRAIKTLSLRFKAVSA